MEMIIIILLVILILVSLFILYINKSSDRTELLVSKINESQAKNNSELFLKLNEFRNNLQKDQKSDFEFLRTTVQDQLEKIGKKVHENLDQGFKRTNETFQSLLERLAKIDEAQKKIENLSQNVVSLQDVLTDKKSRGIFGEVQLNSILNSIFGENNKKIFETQFQLSNNKIVDAILHLPEPIGNICVDSKFPLENFKRMVDRSLTDHERGEAEKEFSRNLKKHIDDISSKYIIQNETAEQAILFLPAEAIFAEIYAYHQSIVEYSQEKKVWITSPSTFMATLTTIQTILMNMERNRYMTVIHQEINNLGDEFSRYQDRWTDLAKHIGTVSKDVEKINITSNKISNRFKKILDVEIENQLLE